MKKTTTLLIICISLFACKKQLNAPLTEVQFVDVLADIHTAEATLESERMNIRDSMGKIYFVQILEKHQVSKTDFDSTFAVYSRQPIRLDTVYNKVLRKLQVRDSTLRGY